MLVRRLAWGVGLVSALVYAVEGGEYGTRDLLAQRAQRAALQDTLDQLREDVDSLQREVKLLMTDDGRLEHLAREQYGMVKGDKEVLYWTVRDAKQAAADSVKAATADSGAGK